MLTGRLNKFKEHEYENRIRGGMYLKQMFGICNMNLIFLHYVNDKYYMAASAI